jgi:NAD-dependent dihydropyrimidine dehydrogenase PreA subunit
MAKIKIDLEKCTGCGTCVDVCPSGVYEIKEGKSVAVNPDACLLCKACEIQCPNNAIEVSE